MLLQRIGSGRLQVRGEAAGLDAAISRSDGELSDDRLQESRRQADSAAVSARIDDAADELEELRRAQDGVGNPGGSDQLFLGVLRAQLAAFRKTVGADDRKRDVMLHASRRFSGKKIPARRFEEFRDRLVLERRRVGDIDDNPGAGQLFGQSLAGEGIDAGPG